MRQCARAVQRTTERAPPATHSDRNRLPASTSPRTAHAATRKAHLVASPKRSTGPRRSGQYPQTRSQSQTERARPDNALRTNEGVKPKRKATRRALAKQMHCKRRVDPGNGTNLKRRAHSSTL